MSNPIDTNNSSQFETPLEEQKDQETTVNTTIPDTDNSKLETIQEEPKVAEKQDWRQKFLLKMSLSYFFLHTILIGVTIAYLTNERMLDDFFRNYSNAGNGYDIFALTLLVLIFILCSIVPSIARKMSIPFYSIIWICVLYLALFAVRYTKKERFNTSEVVVTIYPMFACTSIGLLINVLMKAKGKKGIEPEFGAGISVGLFVITLVLYLFVFLVYDPYMWILMLLVAGSGIWGFYVNQDAKFMVTKRCNSYKEGDWFLGFIHIHTDIFFRFWMDIFRKGDNTLDVDDALENDNTPLGKNDVVEEGETPQVHITI